LLSSPAKHPGKNSPYHSVPLRGKTHDTWFDKPYEPSTAQPAKKKTEEPAIQPPKKKIAALLGGLQQKDNLAD
jgi:hypothetical protein